MTESVLAQPADGVVRNPAPPFIRWLGKGVDLAVICIGAAMIVLVFFNVVLHVFSKDFAWMTELGELLMVWVTFLGGAAAAQRGAHMTITEFLDKLGPQRRLAADAAIQAASMVILGFLVYYGGGIVQGSWGNTLTTLEWPMAWQYMPLPLGAGLMFIFGAWDLLQILRGVPRERRYRPE
jgi:TRAP-type C4-dicarboxylate transport system permease small subunit